MSEVGTEKSRRLQCWRISGESRRLAKTIDSKPSKTDGKRDRYRGITVDSGARESVVNPDDWPNVDLKPSNGSVKVQRYVGPEGEKIDNLEELTVKAHTEKHGGGVISSRMIFQGGKDRKPFLAVSGVIDQGNIVVFDGSGSLKLPNTCAGVASVKKAISGVQGRIPLHAKIGVFVLRTWESEDTPSTGFSRRRAP